MKIRVNIELHGQLRSLAGGVKELTVEIDRGSKLREVLKTLVSKVPKLSVLMVNGSLSRNYLVFINDVDIALLNNEDTEVNDGDRITFIPLSHGG